MQIDFDDVHDVTGWSTEDVDLVLHKKLPGMDKRRNTDNTMVKRRNRQHNAQKKKHRQHNTQKKKHRQHNGQKKKQTTQWTKEETQGSVVLLKFSKGRCFIHHFVDKFS